MAAAMGGPCTPHSRLAACSGQPCRQAALPSRALGGSGKPASALRQRLPAAAAAGRRRRHCRLPVAASAAPQDQQRQQRQEAEAADGGMVPGAAAWELGQAGSLQLAGVLAAALLWVPGALAADVALNSAYDPTGGSDTLKNVAGVAYIGLVIFFGIRLFQRRAKKATSERIASVVDAAAYGGKSSAGEDSDSEDEEEQRAKAAEAAGKDVTWTQAAIGAAQAGIICWVLFQVARVVDGYFEGQALPNPVTQYTAHNIAVLVQTVCRGLVYLLTFIFGANALGLAGLTVQLFIFPEKGRADPRSAPKAAPLPSVSVTDDIGSLRRAFQEAERMGQKQAEKEIKQASRDEP